MGGQEDNVVWLEPGDAKPAAGAPRLLEALAFSKALPPILSAEQRLTRWQWEIFGAFLTIVIIALLLAPVLLGVAAKVVFWLLFSMTVVWRLALTIVGALERVAGPRQSASPSILDNELPVYAVLIALRHEQNMMDQLAASVRAINWPTERLDILLLI
ncbi:MAG: hypothetical protein MK186_15295, partial [Henriciella sp.]|nr:hypothetical protein [Henriciella sp.]